MSSPILLLSELLLLLDQLYKQHEFHDQTTAYEGDPKKSHLLILNEIVKVVVRQSALLSNNDSIRSICQSETSYCL